MPELNICMIKSLHAYVALTELRCVTKGTIRHHWCDSIRLLCTNSWDLSKQAGKLTGLPWKERWIDSSGPVEEASAILPESDKKEQNAKCAREKWSGGPAPLYDLFWVISESKDVDLWTHVLFGVPCRILPNLPTTAKGCTRYVRAHVSMFVVLFCQMRRSFPVGLLPSSPVAMKLRLTSWKILASGDNSLMVCVTNWSNFESGTFFSGLQKFLWVPKCRRMQEKSKSLVSVRTHA